MQDGGSTGLKNWLNPRVSAELELNRPARTVWEKVFRWGAGYLLVTTILGGMAEKLFGEQKGSTPLWLWTLIVPYLFFMAYCSNYVVARFVKSKVVKVAWWCLMGCIALCVALAMLR